MPGVGIHGFTRKALQMAQAGIYDLRIHHDEILWPLLRHWDLFAQGLDRQAEEARIACHPPGQDRPTRQPIRGQTSRHRRQPDQGRRLTEQQSRTSVVR